MLQEVSLAPKDASRKLHINFQIFTFLGSAPSSMCLQSVIMESRKLHINFQIFSTLLESGSTPEFSRASIKCYPWSQRGCWRFLRGVLVAFDIMDVPKIFKEGCTSILRSLPYWKVVQLLDSLGPHPSVILGV